MSSLLTEEIERFLAAIKLSGDAKFMADMRTNLEIFAARIAQAPQGASPEPSVMPAGEIAEIEKRHAEDEERSPYYCDRWRDTDQVNVSFRDAHEDRAALLRLLKSQAPVAGVDEIADKPVVQRSAFVECMFKAFGEDVARSNFVIAYDALIQSGCFRKALSVEEIHEIIERGQYTSTWEAAQALRAAQEKK